ncbi:Sel1 repeat-containing protein [Vibrio crassostreae]|uniref:tetratricopeptide repeat protein n=1 Tax=Vibrio crassostreae TaxID=246167 RepID=UPI000F4AB8E7|nr:tetratricopeptide repeat protein [Vibrio crassostreae]ROR26705.1 Sel1 repeat-containing protein [Vibrio crassostreae]
MHIFSKFILTASVSIMAAGCSSISDERKSAYEAYAAQDYDSAYKQYLALAKKGDSSSQFNLGLMHHNGTGVDKNLDLAKNWYLAAIENDHSDAMNNYGIILENEGDVAGAIGWYNYSARWMNDRAKVNLERLNQHVPEPDLKLNSLDSSKKKRSDTQKWTAATLSLLSGGDGSTAFDDYYTPPSNSNILLFESNGQVVSYISFSDQATIFDWDGSPLAYLVRKNETHTDVYGFNGDHLGWYQDKALFDQNGYATCVSEDYLTNTSITSSPRSKQRLPYKSYREYSPYKPRMKKYFSDLTCKQYLRQGVS